MQQKKKKKEKPHDENIMVCPIPQGDHNYRQDCAQRKPPVFNLLRGRF